MINWIICFLKIKRNYIENAQKNKKYLVVAGCVPQGAPKSSYIAGLSVIGVQQIDRIVEVVEETLKGNVIWYKFLILFLEVVTLNYLIPFKFFLLRPLD